MLLKNRQERKKILVYKYQRTIEHMSKSVDICHHVHATGFQFEVISGFSVNGLFLFTFNKSSNIQLKNFLKLHL